MPATPPALLALSARLLGTAAGQATTRRAFLTLMSRPLPLGAIEAMAAIAPGRAPHPESSAFSDEGHLIEPLGAGPLEGERVAIKDSFDVAGMPTRLGLESESFRRIITAPTRTPSWCGGSGMPEGSSAARHA